jgi:hypothetical protein
MVTGRGADGFVQRLQVMVWPSSFPPFKNVDRAPDAEAEKAMTALFAKLANFAPRDVMDKSFQLQRGLLCARFDSRAQRIFDTWRLKLETRLRGGDRSIARTPAFESYVAKERSLMPSFALIFHVANTEDLLAGIVGDLVVVAAGGYNQAKLVFRRLVKRQGSEGAEPRTLIVQYLGASRFQSQVSAVAGDTRVVSEAVGVVANAELIFGAIEAAIAGHQLSLAIALEAGTGDYV